MKHLELESAEIHVPCASCDIFSSTDFFIFHTVKDELCACNGLYVCFTAEELKACESQGNSARKWQQQSQERDLMILQTSYVSVLFQTGCFYVNFSKAVRNCFA